MNKLYLLKTLSKYPQTIFVSKNTRAWHAQRSFASLPARINIQDDWNRLNDESKTEFLRHALNENQTIFGYYLENLDLGELKSLRHQIHQTLHPDHCKLEDAKIVYPALRDRLDDAIKKSENCSYQNQEKSVSNKRQDIQNSVEKAEVKTSEVVIKTKVETKKAEQKEGINVSKMIDNLVKTVNAIKPFIPVIEAVLNVVAILLKSNEPNLSEKRNPKEDTKIQYEFHRDSHPHKNIKKDKPKVIEAFDDITLDFVGPNTSVNSSAGGVTIKGDCFGTVTAFDDIVIYGKLEGTAHSRMGEVIVRDNASKYRPF